MLDVGEVQHEIDQTGLVGFWPVDGLSKSASAFGFEGSMGHDPQV